MQTLLNRLGIGVVAFVLLGLTSAQETVQLTYVQWGGPDEIEVFQELVDSFNAQNPDVVINFEPVPTDYTTALKTMIAGGTPPDIALIPDDHFSAFAPLGQLVSLEELVKTSRAIDVDNIWPSLLYRFRWDEATRTLGAGDLYTVPREMGSTVMYINKDLFQEAGVELPDPNTPLTFDEMVELGYRLTVDADGHHPGEEGFNPNRVEVWGIGDIWFENAIYNNGGLLLSEDGREWVAPDDQNTIDALQWISDLIHVHQVSPSSQQTESISTSQLFEAGRVAMTTCGRWCNPNFRRVLDFEFDVIPHPVGLSGELTTFNEQGDCTFSGWSGSVGLSIIKGSNGERHAAEAFRFIEFIAGEQGQTAMAALGFQVPIDQDMANSEIFLQSDKNPTNAQVFLDAARCEKPGPWTQAPQWPQLIGTFWWGRVWPEVVIDNTKSAEDALLDSADDFQDALDDAWSSLE